MSYVNRLITNAAFNKKIGKFQNKMSDVSALVPNNAFNTKIGEVEKKFLVMLKILPLLKLIKPNWPNFRYRTYFKQGVPSDSGNYRV